MLHKENTGDLLLSVQSDLKGVAATDVKACITIVRKRIVQFVSLGIVVPEMLVKVK